MDAVLGTQILVGVLAITVVGLTKHIHSLQTDAFSPGDAKKRATRVPKERPETYELDESVNPDHSLWSGVKVQYSRRANHASPELKKRETAVGFWLANNNIQQVVKEMHRKQGKKEKWQGKKNVTVYAPNHSTVKRWIQCYTDGDDLDTLGKSNSKRGKSKVATPEMQQKVKELVFDSNYEWDGYETLCRHINAHIAKTPSDRWTASTLARYIRHEWHGTMQKEGRVWRCFSPESMAKRVDLSKSFMQRMYEILPGEFLKNAAMQSILGPFCSKFVLWPGIDKAHARVADLWLYTDFVVPQIYRF
jgi:hypothetical protein